MKTQEQLINNIIGQLNGVKKMIKQDKDCLEIIHQIKATKSAISSLMNKFIGESFLKCKNNPKLNQQNIEKLFKELIDNT